MSFAAGKRCIIRDDADEDPDYRGAIVTVFAYSGNGRRVCVRLDNPVKGVRGIWVKAASLGSRHQFD